MKNKAGSERKVTATIALFSMGFAAVSAVPLAGILGFASLIDPDLPPREFYSLWARNVLQGGGIELLFYGLAAFGGLASALVNTFRAITGRGTRVQATLFTVVGAGVCTILFLAYFCVLAI